MERRKPIRVVIVGAGVAGLETALALRSFAAESVAVELIDPETQFTYRPLAVAEPFRAAEAVRFPLHSLAEAAGATLRRGRLAAVAPDEKTVELEGGEMLDYDALVLALGAVPREAIPGALTFRGPEDGAALSELLEGATTGHMARLIFAAPAGASWPLPLYELALLTSDYLAERLAGGIEISIATPEDRPLALFGAAASDAIRELLSERGIGLRCSDIAIGFDEDGLHIAGGGLVEADAVVALPRLEGPHIVGIPRDNTGFVPTDDYGWVLGLTDVYAAGDLTQFPVKQGGIATQQADTVASAIAADLAGAARPAAFKPVLRGLLLTGMSPRFLRFDMRGRSLVDTEPLWWPPAKIVGRFLTPVLADHLGLAKEFREPLAVSGVAVDVELETVQHSTWTAV